MFRPFSDRRRTPGRFAVRLGFGLVCVLAVAALFGYAVMILWNSVLVEVVPVRRIGFWQAAGLLVLSRILVGSLHGHSGHHGGHSKHCRFGRHRECLDEFVERGRPEE